jgi:hypothetical protein
LLHSKSSGLRAVLLAFASIAGVLDLEACGRSQAAAEKPFAYQVVRLPGTSSCALIELKDSLGVREYPEVIGLYRSKTDAEADLARFASTQDPMTVAGTTICQK